MLIPNLGQSVSPYCVVGSILDLTLHLCYSLPLTTIRILLSLIFPPPRSVTPTRLLCTISRTHISIPSACRRLIGIFYRLVVGECSWCDPNLQWLTALNFRSCYSFTFISIIAYSRVRHISSVYIHHTPSGVITFLRNVSPHRFCLACAFPSRSVGMPKPRHWQHPYISTSYYRDPRHPTLSTPFPHSWSAHSLFITLSTRVPVFSRNHLLCPLELALLQSTHTHTEAGFAARHSV